jgi:demethylmenaquinone methyltransferase / 2-methoxy-6-polyprenyl-1,4-benzoquinol methylase
MPGQDPRAVRRMFAALAPRYNLLNHLLSGCLDRSWRRSLVAALHLPDGARVLDICAGTAHLARECLRKYPRLRQIVVSDFVPEMLALAPESLRTDDRFAFLGADAQRLPFGDAQFDATMNAFGLRNTADPSAAAAEMVRVTRRGGMVGILEFFRPRPGFWRSPPGLWVRYGTPLLGRLISPHPQAYSYLPRSLDEFVSLAECAENLRQCGCEITLQQVLPGGVAAALVARRT